MAKAVVDIEAELKQVELETAQIRLEQMKEENEAYRAKKAARLRANAQNLAQLRADHTEKRGIIKTCTHRKGGSIKRPRGGKDKSALNLAVMPDGRQLIVCGNCPLRVWSPFPGDKNPQQRKGETAEQAKERVAKYALEQAEFDRLVEHSEDQLTDEAAQPMHCGKQFSFQGRDGNNMAMPAPCDGYAQGRDNRVAA